MLTLRFPAAPGEAVISSRARCFRFCADGSVRGGDNAVAAERSKDGWVIAHGLYRQVECSGPLVVQMRKTADAAMLSYGPVNSVRVSSGILVVDDGGLRLWLPTWQSLADVPWHEVMLLPAPAPQ